MVATGYSKICEYLPLPTDMTDSHRCRGVFCAAIVAVSQTFINFAIGGGKEAVLSRGAAPAYR